MKSRQPDLSQRYWQSGNKSRLLCEFGWHKLLPNIVAVFVILVAGWLTALLGGLHHASFHKKGLLSRAFF